MLGWTMVLGWLAASTAAAGPCSAQGGPACLERANKAQERGRTARADRLYRKACTPAHPAQCGPLFDRDPDAVRAVLQTTWKQCDAGSDAQCLVLADARGPAGPRRLRSYQRAVQGLAQSCERDHGPACARVAELLTTVDPDLPYAPAGARGWLERGCTADHGVSCRDLARMRVNGAGGPVDGPGASDAMALACEQEVEGACRTSARWWSHGRGVERNEAEAIAAWTRACAQDPSDCPRAARYLLEDEPEADTDRLRAEMRRGCVDGSADACAAVLMTGMDGLEPLQEATRREDALGRACKAGHAGSCATLAEVRKGPVADQLALEAAGLERQYAPHRYLAPTAGGSGWSPDRATTEACVRGVIERLATPEHQGRHSPSPGQDRATAWLTERMQAAGLVVEHQPVQVRRRGGSWIEVRGTRYPAIAASGSPSGAFQGRVHVVDGAMEPGSVPGEAAAVLIAVGRLTPDVVPAVITDVPVLAVHRNVAALARGRAVAGTALAPLRPDIAHNVVGVLPGRGDLAAESIVLGAHYDSQGSELSGAFRPGADDNASGTAGVVCAAEALHTQLASQPSHRTYVFIGFTGEELGLYGSRAYPWAPAHPNPVAMINLDMIGRVRDGDVQARITGAGWRPRIAAELDQAGIRVVETGDVQGTSDHMPFLAQGVPAVHFFSGTHGDYHRPTDTPDRVNMAGAAKVTDLAAAVAYGLRASPVELGPLDDPCTELTVWPLQVGLHVSFLDGFARREVRCVAPELAGHALGVMPGDIVYGLDTFRKDWPTEPATLHVLRGTACFAMAVGKEARQVPCEAMPD